MFSAMLRIYQDTEAPHDMYPGLESCRQIKDLARHKFDGEYLIRSEIVAQLAQLWSQSDCSRYTALLRNSSREAVASQKHSGAARGGSDKDSRPPLPNGPSFESSDAAEDFTGSAVYNPVLAGEMPTASHDNMTSLHAPTTPSISSRADDVPSPPPRGLA
jgi:hypothetical protein